MLSIALVLVLAGPVLALFHRDPSPFFPIDNETSIAFKTMKEICNDQGFAFEEYNITTSDGYLLALFRISGKKFE